MWLSIFYVYRFYPATGTRVTFVDGVLLWQQRPRPGSCLDEIAEQATCGQRMTTTRRTQVKDDFGMCIFFWSCDEEGCALFITATAGMANRWPGGKGNGAVWEHFVRISHECGTRWLRRPARRGTYYTAVLTARMTEKNTKSRASIRQGRACTHTAERQPLGERSNEYNAHSRKGKVLGTLACQAWR